MRKGRPPIRRGTGAEGTVVLLCEDIIAESADIAEAHPALRNVLPQRPGEGKGPDPVKSCEEFKGPP